MPTKNEDGTIPVTLTDEQVTMIEELAAMSDLSFDVVADEVINEALKRELPGILARRKQ